MKDLDISDFAYLPFMIGYLVGVLPFSVLETEAAALVSFGCFSIFWVMVLVSHINARRARKRLSREV